jgi:hypothetical protein
VWPLWHIQVPVSIFQVFCFIYEMFCTICKTKSVRFSIRLLLIDGVEALSNCASR